MSRKFIITASLVFSLIILSVYSFAADTNSICYDYGVAAERSEYIINDNPSYFTGDEIITLKDPVCPGFEFAGWYLESDYRTPVTAIERSDGDITLYAKWYETAYRITYVLIPDGINLTENEINNLNPDRRNAGEAVYLTSPDCAVSYYTFEGWYFDSGYTERAEYIEKYTCSDVTLYAHWVNTGFTVQYVLGDIATSVYTVSNPNPVSYKYGDGFTLLPVLTEDPAYTFDGWYSDEFFTSSVTGIQPGTYGNIILYAKWTKAVYGIDYVLTDGNITDESEVENSNPDTRKANESVILNDPVSTNKRYRFAGWYTSPERDENSRIAEIKASHQGSITVYAKWETAVYSITYNYGIVNPIYVSFENNNPGKYLFGEGFVLQPLEINGFIFNGWCTDEKLKNRITEISADAWGDMKLYADFTEKTYTIEYILEDKEVTAAQVVNTNPTVRTTTERVGFEDARTINANYQFGGWYYDKEFTREATVIRPYTAENVTVYAKWVKIVTYLPVWGDATLSNQLSAADARLVLRYAAGIETFNDIQIRLADINNDSKVQAADARLILRLSAGLEKEEELIERYSLPIIELVDGEVVFRERE